MSSERSALAVVRALIGHLLSDPEPELAVECLAMATGIGYDGSTPAAVAKRHRTTVAKVYERIRDHCEAVGLPVPEMAQRKSRGAAR